MEGRCLFVSHFSLITIAPDPSRPRGHESVLCRSFGLAVLNHSDLRCVFLRLTWLLLVFTAVFGEAMLPQLMKVKLLCLSFKLAYVVWH